MTPNWMVEKLLEALRVLSAHDERLKTLESDRDKRSRFFSSGAPQWLAVFIALAALLVSLFK